MPVGITAEETALLEREDPEILTALEAKRRAVEDVLYPQPTMNDVYNFYTAQKNEWGGLKAQQNVHRAVRYLRDMTPEKWSQYLEDDRRIRTRLSHNEILRVSAQQAKARMKITQRPAGSTPDAVDKAKKQQRWMEEFFPAMEQRHPKGLRRRFVDAQNGDGMAVYEVYLTGAYEERVDLKRKVDAEGLEEEDDAYVERTEGEILQLGQCAPIGLRVIDCLAAYFDFGEDDYEKPASHGVRRALIAQRMNYRELYAAQMKTKGPEKLEELRLPKPGDSAWPADAVSWGITSEDTSSGVQVNDPGGEVEYIRYYDGVWLVEIIGGKEVTNRRHGLPGVPVFPCFAIVTGSSFLSEQIQGVTWGMLDLELAANDLATYKLDTTVTYGRPAPIAETDVGGQILVNARKEPVNITLDDPSEIKQLGAGQHITDAWKDFRQRIGDTDIVGFIQLWERNGLNPITQGQSPGSDSSGYMGNLLMGASLALYDSCVEFEEKTNGQVLDFVRLMIRDTIKERCYLAVPMEDRKIGGTEWLGLGPEDIDETPCVVRINPQSEANKLANRQSLMMGHQGKYISRVRVQQEGYEIEDPETEDIAILEEEALERLGALVVENVMMRARIPQPQPQQPSGLVGPDGNPIQSAPKDPQAPEKSTVGAAANGASQGFSSKARAGQQTSYAPPEGAASAGGR